jgi:SAM-dependent methyltransferase
MSQADLPTGTVGQLFGRVMGWLNADMERRAIEHLALLGHEHVLEIGFGSGVGIALLVARLGAPRVAGVEPSRVMLHQARARLPRPARAQVRLVHGTAAAMPLPDASFDAAVSVNNIQLWDLPGDLREVRRVLKPGGRLSVAVHGWVLGDRLGTSTAAQSLARLQQLLAQGGFGAGRGRVARSRTGTALYLLAER